MKRYSHLTENERYQIKTMISLGHGIGDTALHLQRGYSTIKRELTRNRGGRGYRPKQAHALAEGRLRQRARANARRIDRATWDKVEAALQRQYSPQQISGRLKLEGEPAVSHESIYRYVYAEKRTGGTLWFPMPRSRRSLTASITDRASPWATEHPMRCLCNHRNVPLHFVVESAVNIKFKKFKIPVARGNRL